MGIRFYENSISRSLALHALLLMFAIFYALNAKPPQFNTEPIEITMLEPKDEAKPSDLGKEKSKAIVQKSQGEEIKEAKRDSYLSDKSRVVKEELSARNSGEAALTQAATPKAMNPTEPQKNKAVNLSDLGLKIATKPNKDFHDQRNWAAPQTGEMIRGGQYMQGMKEGEVSALNTKEFVFFSYFDRVRKQLDQTWTPLLRENIQKIYRSGRKLASNEDHVTRTIFTLNTKGEITRVQILEESGTHDIDQAAIDALNHAGPYPNPPKGLVSEQGTVEIRWDFILKT